ncbi:hypothetical protein PTKIN_Ptkin12aG0071700 [Pterospermum kingtungense]
MCVSEEQIMEMVPKGQSPTGSAHPDKQDESKSNSPARNTKTSDICFSCGKQGHWAKDCPTKARASSPSPSSQQQQQDIHHLPVLRCHCGVTCTIHVSRSEANPGRRYYSRNCTCDNVKGKNFYQWCDNVKAIMCKCGAGACTINIHRDHNGKDIKYYTCRIRTGHGSCGFLLFDSPPNSPNSPNSITMSRSVEKDNRPSVMSSKHGEPPNIMTDQNNCLTSFSDKSIVVPEAKRCNRVMGKGKCVSLLTSHSDIHFRQIDFLNETSLAGNSPNGCKVLQNLVLHVHGWVGRLAFPPPRILADPPLRHFYCCIYPLFDPILVTKYVDTSDSGSSRIIPHASSDAEVDELQNALGNDAQLLGVPLGTSSLKRSVTAVQEDVTNYILKEVGKKLQKDLLTLLESMEPPDHDSMLKAANSTFDALACLSIECGPFAEHVMNFIRSASRVPRMESNVQDNCNLQALTIHKNIERCLNDISGIHAELFAALTASSNFQSACNGAYHLSDKLHPIQSQLHSCLTETSKLETFLLDIAKNVGQSKRSMQTAYQELTKALNLRLEEEEQCMTNTVLRVDFT